MNRISATAQELGVKDAFDIRQNIMGGTQYLKSLIDIYDGDVRLALLAYNWGKGKVRDWLRGSGAPTKEAREYLEKILGSSVEEIHKLDDKQLKRYLDAWEEIKDLQRQNQDK